MMHRQPWLLALALGLPPVAAGAQVVTGETDRLDRIVRAHPCADRNFPIEVRGPAQFRPRACSLLSFAVDELERGAAARLGVSAGDTIRILYAVVSELRIPAWDSTARTRLPQGDQAYCDITLDLKGRDASLRFLIDAKTGSARFSDSESIEYLRLRRPP
jgi:hypothetical protein